MYAFEYDEKTGGIKLNPLESSSAREPRPVYAAELDNLGFDSYWNYQKQNDIPYMWADSVEYHYRGKLVAKLTGGDIYTAPQIILAKDDPQKIFEPEPNGKELRPIDIQGMLDLNDQFLIALEREAIQKIIDTYESSKNANSQFYVAFSGGKDSAVILDLVRKALPVSDFFILFADTGMEFPDTYDLIEELKKEWKRDNIYFEIAKSHLSAEEAWEKFGPPARVLGWCCSVLKSVPQTLTLRKRLSNFQKRNAAFVGVRNAESEMRSLYTYESIEEKIKGHDSYNLIKDWSSAEVWLYIFKNKIRINKAYKKGCARVGCICCPKGGGRSSYLENRCYPVEKGRFISLILDSDARELSTDYIVNGAWNARKNGVFLRNNPTDIYSEKTTENLTICVKRPRTNWKEWIKILGELTQVPDSNKYIINFDEQYFEFLCIPNEDNFGYTITLDSEYLKSSKRFVKYFRYIFRRAAYCLSCRTCQANCYNNCITFEPDLKVSNCRHCLKCFDIPAGCLAYKSLCTPEEEQKVKISLNNFSNHSPKTEWLEEFFQNREKFLEDNTLGKVQRSFFKRFLKDSGLIDGKNVTKLVELFGDNWNTPTLLGLMLINLSFNTPQIRWYIQQLPIGKYVSKDELVAKLINQENQSQGNISSIMNALGRLSNSEHPFCKTLTFSFSTDDGFVRSKCQLEDNRVFLYGLFKFAEQCESESFSVTKLYDEEGVRDGISPTEIFGIERKELLPILKGLSVHYPDFIYASFTHDLEKVTIKIKSKTSTDVLSLFEE